LEYYSIESEHFIAHYHSGLEGLAERSLELAEKAHETLSPRLEWVPNEKTHIVINDKTDAANGSAGVFGRNVININAMPPEPEGVLGYYNDWLNILILHEYVHILHLDTKSGLAPLLNTIFGKQVNPNQILPRWYIEGIAIYYETDITGTGRLANSLWDTWIRMAALEGPFFDLGTFTGSPTHWPFGNTPYLYGSYFIDYIVDKHGEDFIPRFNHIYGSRIIPYSMNQAANEICSQTFDEMWQEWHAHANGKALAQRTEVIAEGRTPVEDITHTSGQHSSPSLRPSHNEFTYLHSDFQSDAHYRICQTDNLNCSKLTEIDGASGTHSWTPNGQNLIFSRQQVDKNVYRYHELFSFTPKTESVRQITSNQRAIDLDTSPRSGRVAFVSTDDGTTELRLSPLPGAETYETETLVDAESRARGDWTSQQISGPQFGPAGQKLFFSWWRASTGQRNLWLYDVSAEDGDRLKQLTETPHQELDPFFDGKHLYFTSDRDGIFNIYRMDLASGTTTKVSNVVSGLFTPVTRPEMDRIIVTRYSAEGNQLASIPKDDKSSREIAYGTAELPSAEPNGTVAATSPDSYTGIRWLQPLIFRPEAALLRSGGGLGGTLEGYDPIGHHSYSLSAAWVMDNEAATQATGASLEYEYSGWPVDISLGTRVRDYPRNQSLIRESRFVRFFEREYAGNLSLSYPLQSVSDSLYLSATLEGRHTGFSDRPETTPDPGDIEPQNPENGWFNETSFQIFYSNVEQYIFTAGPAKGVSGHARVAFQNDMTGSDFDATTFDYNLRGYHPSPWFDQHIFTLGVSGGATYSNLRGQTGFAIGGYRPQDFLNSILLRQSGAQLLLRGYPANVVTGTHFQLLNGEYRFPLWDMDEGLSTLPLFFKRLKGAVFADSGIAGSRSDMHFSNLRTSVGAELTLDTTMGYSFSSPFRVGYARGLSQDGVSEWYLRYGGRF
jgi:Tol biopolymer transport system component